MHLGEQDANPFDHVMIQSDAEYLPSHNAHASSFLGCDDSMLDEYALIVNKIRFKKDLLDLAGYYSNKFELDENTVGVHCRITDLNQIHAQYGYVTFENYKTTLADILQTQHKIFVASDNEESINKLVDIYGDRVTYVPDLLRSKEEFCSDHTPMQVRELRKERLIQEAFLETILLSRCGTFVHRPSTMSSFIKVLRRLLRKNNNIQV